MATKLIFKNVEDYRRSLRPEVYSEMSPAEIRQDERERIRHEHRMAELSAKERIGKKKEFVPKTRKEAKLVENVKGIQRELQVKKLRAIKKEYERSQTFGRKYIGNVRAPTGIKRQYVAPVQRFAQQLFPQVPMSMPSYPVQSRIYQGKKGRPARGRPYGSFKYGMPISEYKRMMRAAKSRARAQQMMALNVARARQGMQRQIYRQMPQQYPQQMPQGPPQKPGFFERGLFKHNLFGQGGPPRQVYRREAPVYYPEQYPQEMPVYSNGPVEYESKTSPTQQVVYQRPPQREIVPVFKSSGGHPFTPVPQERPIANSPNTEYYEDRDLMTSKIILKRRPQAEAWIR